MKITKDHLRKQIAEIFQGVPYGNQATEEVLDCIFEELKPAIDLYNMAQDYHKPTSGESIPPKPWFHDPGDKGTMDYTDQAKGPAKIDHKLTQEDWDDLQNQYETQEE